MNSYTLIYMIVILFVLFAFFVLILFSLFMIKREAHLKTKSHVLGLKRKHHHK